jgi:hypothetical protein
MRTIFRVVTLTVLLALAGRGTAHAGPLGPDVIIGTFDWVDDILFGSGSTFSVSNESSSTFEAVSVDLFAPGDATPFQTLTLGEIPSLGFAQSFEDLSSLLAGTDLSEAMLHLTFDSTPLAVTLFAASLVGDPSALLTTSIDIQAPTPVPEPSTLMLLTGGLVVAARRNRRKGVRRFPERSGASLQACPSSGPKGPHDTGAKTQQTASSSN